LVDRYSYTAKGRNWYFFGKFKNDSFLSLKNSCHFSIRPTLHDVT
jgi:hypothetical protein